tara:strand:- start:5758 stop:7581 length:1824 start_codon:yes stop_codon:yes gene_type:complete
MIEKVLTYDYGDNNSEILQLLHPGHLTKTAEYSDELNGFIESLKGNDNKSYALVNALGAGEYFGANKNGDYFPEEVLGKYHKTFEALAHVYRHHVNKDPQKSMGKVVFSHYNPKMKRVELILELDNNKAEDVLYKLDKGHLPSVSMGCRVPYDVCSICNNKAKTRAEYCDHLTKSIGKVLPDGKRVYAVNTMPKFFDISVVTIPADRTASFLSKVASDNSGQKIVRSSIEGSEKLKETLEKVANLESRAYLNKKVVGKIDAIIPNKKLKDKHGLVAPKKMTEEQMEKLNSYSFSDILSTFMGLQILPHREDFQKLALYSQGLHKQADQLEQDGVVFEVTPETPIMDIEGVSLDNFNEEVAKTVQDDVALYSLSKQAMVTRGVLKLAANEGFKDTPHGFIYDHQKKDPSFVSKTVFGHRQDPDLTSHKNPAVPLGILASLYYSYSKMIPKASTGMFRKFLGKHPWLLPIMVGAGTVGTLKAQEHAFKKIEDEQKAEFNKVGAYPMAAALSIPASYYVGAVAEEKARRRIPISKKENFVRKHPALVALLGTLIGGKAGVKAKRALKKIKGGFKKRANFNHELAIERRVANVVAQMDNKSLDSLFHELVN